MQTSDKGLNVIRSFEGRALRAYKDAVGVITIGYGNTNFDPTLKALLGRPLQMGDSITAEQAESLFVNSIRTQYEPSVRSTLKDPSQGAFDAGTSFHYNTGAIKKATWPKSLNAGNKSGAKASILSWDKAGGRVLSGLTRRRRREWAMIDVADYGPEGSSGPVEIGVNGRATGKVVPLSGTTAPNVGIASTSPGPGMLGLNDTGPEVMELQDWLIQLGYLVGKPSGTFDVKTEAAVKKFQGSHPNLTKDGVVGPASRNALIRDLDMREKVKGVAKKAAVGAGSSGLAWGGISATLGKILLVSTGVLGVVVLAYIAYQYRDEIRGLVNRLFSKEVA